MGRSPHVHRARRRRRLDRDRSGGRRGRAARPGRRRYRPRWL